MRVAIVCPYDLGEHGGVQQLTTELVKHLQTGGDSAILIGAGKNRRHGGPGRDGTIAVGRGFKVTGNQSKVPLTLAPMSFRRMSKALAGVDVVHLHEPFVPLAGWAALRSKKPMVVTFHADPPRWVGRAYRAIPWARRRMNRAVLTAVSDAARGSIPDSWGEVRIIPNAIDTASYDLPVGRISRRIAFLGRDEPRKGLDIALSAFSKVHDQHPEAELVVMGAKREGGPTGVKFLGRVTEGEKRRTLASSAIYVAPNTGGESFGIVLAEAMAAGCAVIASDLDAFREVLQGHGLTVPVGDSSALAGAIGRLLDNVGERERLGAAGNRAVQRYDWGHVLNQYRDAYTKAIASG